MGSSQYYPTEEVLNYFPVQKVTEMNVGVKTGATINILAFTDDVTIITEIS